MAAPQVLVCTRDGDRIVWIMQPQCAHDRHTRGGAFVYRAVQVRQHAITQFQVLSTDRLDLRIVQLIGVRNRGAIVIADFNGSGITRVPAPGESQFPGAAVRAEQGAEGSELKPA